MRRVVVTGIGLVTPFGVGIEHNWQSLIQGKSGIRQIESIETADLPAKIAGEVPVGPTAENLFAADDWVEPKDQRRMDPFIIYGLAASVQAVRDSGWQATTEEDQFRTGVMIGSGIGGLPGISECAVTLNRKDRGACRRSSSRRNLINLCSGNV